MTSPASSSPILLKARGPVLELWLNRPEQRNAMTPQMALDILSCFEAIRDDRTVRVRPRRQMVV